MFDYLSFQDSSGCCEFPFVLEYLNVISYLLTRVYFPDVHLRQTGQDPAKDTRPEYRTSSET